MTKYIAELHYCRIKEVTVEKETEKSIWVKGNRRAKITEWDVYCDSFDEAKKVLVDKAIANVETQTSILQAKYERLKKAKALATYKSSPT